MVMNPMAREFDGRLHEISSMICVHTNQINRSDALILLAAENMQLCMDGPRSRYASHEQNKGWVVLIVTSNIRMIYSHE